MNRATKITHAPRFEGPAILVIIYNRADCTRRVFEAINALGPSRLYVAADGPHVDKPNDQARTLECRKMARSLTSHHNVRFLCHEENQGCRLAVRNAIDWFFEHEEMGIILEDDTIPKNAFFHWCSTQLNKFQHDKRIGAILGYNRHDNRVYRRVDSHGFLAQMFCPWGWATWRDRWNLYREDHSDWETINRHRTWKNISTNPFHLWFLELDFKTSQQSKMNTWDTYFQLSCMRHKRLFVLPPVNLVSNIGAFGTHSNKISKGQFTPTFELPSAFIKSPAEAYHIENFYDRTQLTATVKIHTHGLARAFIGKYLRKAHLLKPLSAGST